MRAVIGIGNPGAEYDGTRHNLGFAVVDELARRAGTGGWQSKWKSLVADWRLPAGHPAERALLVKPQTYVNLSGDAALAVMAFHQLTPIDLLVVVDDLALALGHLRLRPEGSAGGHNGLRDLEAKIGKAYPRLRLGMGPVPPGHDQVGFVLGRFAPDQRAVAESMVARAADAVEAWLREGVQVACRFNGPPAPPPAPPAPKRDPAAGAPRTEPPPPAKP